MTFRQKPKGWLSEAASWRGNEQELGGGGGGGAILTGDHKGNGLEELQGVGGAIENDMANFAFF